MNKLKTALATGVAVAYAFPLFAFAAASNLLGLQQLATGISNIVTKLMPAMVGIAFIFFAIGLIRFIIAADPEKQKEAKSLMFWSVIAMVVLVSIAGIAVWVRELFGISGTQTLPTPQL